VSVAAVHVERRARSRGPRGPRDLEAIQAIVANRLDASLLGDAWLCAIIGERPSHGARTPALWNAAFADLLFPARLLPFDVPAGRLPQLLDVLRTAERFLGGCVAEPYKASIGALLDEVESEALLAGAVNVIYRTPEGRLVGANTDGTGALRALTRTAAGAAPPLVPDLAGRRILLIGAGAVARAVAHAVSGAVRDGVVVVANRNVAAAAEVAATLAAAGVRAEAIAEADVPRAAPEVDVVMNCTAKGRAGWQCAGEGRAILLEPYSALGPASPEPVNGVHDDDETRRRAFLSSALPDILRNAEVSTRTALAIPARVPFFDAVCEPRETAFLRDGRMTGHATLGGAALGVAQAADALVFKVCARLVGTVAHDPAAVHHRVRAVMTRAW
jgi:shikimate dehydrogenase